MVVASSDAALAKAAVETLSRRVLSSLERSDGTAWQPVGEATAVLPSGSTTWTYSRGGGGCENNNGGVVFVAGGRCCRR